MRSTGYVIAPEQTASQQFPTLRRLLQYLRPYRKELPIALGLVIIGAATQAMGPFLIGWSIDHLRRAHPNQDQSAFEFLRTRVSRSRSGTSEESIRSRLCKLPGVHDPSKPSS